MSSKYTTVSRLRDQDTSVMTQWVYPTDNSGPGTTTVTTKYLGTTETKMSRGNAFRRLGPHSEDYGSDFNLKRFSVELLETSGPFHITYPYVQNTWDVRSTQAYPISGFPNYTTPLTALQSPLLSTSDLTALGTKAVSLCAPGAPKASLSQALIELKNDGLPTAASSIFKRGLTRGSASDYLNVQFGWLPLVSDITKIAKSVINADKLLQGLRANAGKQLKRRFEFPEKLVSSTTNLGCLWVGHAFAQGNQKGSLTSVDSTKVWFEGSFDYSYPVGDDLLSRSRAAAIDARYILGLDLSPETIWNVLPWSWMADWFFNIGDILSNLSNQMYTNTVMRYGYVMRTQTIVKDYVGSAVLYGDVPVFAHARTSYVVKQRIKATPFGFGLVWSGFSPFQISILAALGLSNRRG